MQKGLHKAHRLVQRQTEQILEGQPELNRSTLELRVAPTCAHVCRWQQKKPCLHLSIQMLNEPHALRAALYFLPLFLP